jgi:glucosamine--fructose-6-phosphate aminotransferase (isomerizing)
MAEKAKEKRKVFLTGEGSSRIFPAKNAISKAKILGLDLEIFCEGGRQAEEYQLENCLVIGASNSGKTREVIELFKKLKGSLGVTLAGLTANKETPLELLAEITHILNCGKEEAVAATKSVIEQALFYQGLLYCLDDKGRMQVDLNSLSEKIEQALQLEIPQEITQDLVKAPIIYFAGRNNGVAEELTLKTNEITRKKSAYLEGTYAVHGIEEVMDQEEVVVVIEPFKKEIEKFKEVLIKGVGMKVIAISKEETDFPTIKIPSLPFYDEYLQLAAGWNLLVEIGVSLGINLDKPTRARKVGNIYLAS